jgi:hypothetical protein
MSIKEIARQAARSMKTYDSLDQVADAVTLAVGKLAFMEGWSRRGMNARYGGSQAEQAFADAFPEPPQAPDGPCHWCHGTGVQGGAGCRYCEGPEALAPAVDPEPYNGPPNRKSPRGCIECEFTSQLSPGQECLNCGTCQPSVEPSSVSLSHADLDDLIAASEADQAPALPLAPTPPYCSARAANGYVCTMRQGHSGEHVATDTTGAIVYVRWHPAPTPPGTATGDTYEKLLRSWREYDECIQKIANLCWSSNDPSGPRDVVALVARELRDLRRRAPVESLSSPSPGAVETPPEWSLAEAIEREMDASEPRPPGGQQVGPSPAAWHMTPTTRSRIRRLLREWREQALRSGGSR